MKKIIKPLTVTFSLASLHAGENIPIPPEQPTSSISELIDWGGNVRLRTEYREQDGLDGSTAGTIRFRPFIKLGSFYGLSAFVEGEFTQDFFSDYDTNPTPITLNSDEPLGNTVISDPRNTELNQAYLKYEREEFWVKAGRQKIIRNGSAFIGNVGWRQNEQTYDAISIGSSGEHFKFDYSYSNRVVRIFGNEAINRFPLGEMEGDFHFFDASYEKEGHTIGAYFYGIDTDSNIAAIGDSMTFGTYYKGNGVYAELAYQEGDFGSIDDYSALYSHVSYSKKIANHKITGGIEYLGENFRTPFATVHKFNGFADAFALQRLGLAGGLQDGLTDFYISYVPPKLPGDITLKTFAHYFMDGSVDEKQGWELDFVLAKKINKHTKALVKGAYFDGDDGRPNIKQLSAQLDFQF